MKNKTFVITFLSVAAFAVGCNKEQTTSQQLDNVQAETKQAAQDMKDYTYAHRQLVRGLPDLLRRGVHLVRGGLLLLGGQDRRLQHRRR